MPLPWNPPRWALPVLLAALAAHPAVADAVTVINASGREWRLVPADPPKGSRTAGTLDLKEERRLPAGARARIDLTLEDQTLTGYFALVDAKGGKVTYGVFRHPGDIAVFLAPAASPIGPRDLEAVLPQDGTTIRIVGATLP